MNAFCKCGLLIFLFLAGLNTVSGQINNQWHVTYLRNDPDKIRSIAFLLGGYTETWQTNSILLGFGLGADIHFSKHTDLYIMGRNATWDDYKKPATASNPYWFNHEEAIVGFNILNKYKDKFYKVGVAARADGSASAYISPTLTRRTSLALRTGLFHIGTPYDQDKIKAYKLQQTGNPANDTVWQSGINYMDITALVLGVSVKNIHYGVLSIGSPNTILGEYAEYYFDILPLLGLQMNESARYIQRLGYRFGLRLSSISSTGLWIGLEFGDRPGPGEITRLGYFTPHSYAEVSLGLSLAKKEKL